MQAYNVIILRRRINVSRCCRRSDRRTPSRWARTGSTTCVGSSAGGGLLMCGGYFSFSGYSGRAAFAVRRSRPSCRSCRSAVSTIEPDGPGLQMALTDAGRCPSHHDRAPHRDRDYLMLGYNRVRAKPEADVLAEYNGDPQIAVAEFGRGRSMAFASDVALPAGRDPSSTGPTTPRSGSGRCAGSPASPERTRPDPRRPSNDGTP